MANEGHPDCWSSWAKHVPCHPCTGFSQTFVFPGTAIFTHSLICYHYPGSSPLYCKNLPWRNWTKTFSHLFNVKYLKKRAWEQFYTWRAKSCKNVLMQIYRLIFFFLTNKHSSAAVWTTSPWHSRFIHWELGVFLPLLRALLREQRIKTIKCHPKSPSQVPH